MKYVTLFTLAFFALGQMAFSQDVSPNTIQSYEEVLKRLPTSLRETKATQWTGIQQEAANAALKEALIETSTPASLRLTVTNVANWEGLTLFSEVPNKEGYHIRVFGKFTEDWKPKLEALKKGDSVIMEGVLSSVTYRGLWGKFTLSICLQGCTFTKDTTDRPEPGATRDR